LGVDSRPSDEMLLLGVAGGRGRHRRGGRGGRLRVAFPAAATVLLPICFALLAAAPAK
jgi:hypothetical protein